MSATEPRPEILQASQEAEALHLARSAVESWVLRQEALHDAPSRTGLEQIIAPAFVTLSLQERLRGCVGALEPARHLGRTLMECAVAAATRDPRFPPVGVSELASIRFEISVLTIPILVGDPKVVQVGRDGVIVAQKNRTGLLLPQVAVQQGWDSETLLDHACLKAGLKAAAWRQGARIWTFQAQVFAERETGADFPVGR